MRLETIEKYDPYSRILKIPKGTVLSQIQVKNAETGLENTKIVRKVFADYFERKGKSQSERARELDMCLEARESFLRLKLYFFDKARKEKWQNEIVEGVRNVKREMREIRQRQILGVDQLLRPFMG